MTESEFPVIKRGSLHVVPNPKPGVWAIYTDKNVSEEITV
jgi:hypothetical protein